MRLRELGFGRHSAGWRLALFTLCALAAGARPADPSPAEPPAEPVWIEDLSDTHAVVERWGQGSLAFAREGGFAWATCTTRGAGSPVLVTNARPYAPPRDLRGRFLETWIWVDDVSRLRSLELRLSSDGFASNAFTFTIPLFSDADFSLVQSKTWVPLTLSFGAARVRGEPDLARIDSVAWYVEDRGTGPLRFAWGGLAAHRTPREGVVSFSFDDGYDEHIQIAAPALAEAGMRGTAYVMPDQIGQPGYLRAEDLATLRDRYGWDVAAHHAVPFTELSDERLEPAILGIRRYLVRHGFGRGADHLALPLGKHDPKRVMPLVRKHFRTARLAGAGPETLPPADPHRLRVLNVLSSTPPGAVAEWARRARDHGEWAILMFHYLVEKPAKETDYAIRDFRQVVRAVKQSGVRVRTVSEVWDSLESQRRERMRASRPDRDLPAAPGETPNR